MRAPWPMLMTSFIFMIISTASYLMLWSPLSCVVRERYIGFVGWRDVSQESGIGIGSKNSTNYLIFDAIEHNGSLEFLDGLSTKWEILVVNLAERYRLKSCRRCLVVGATWTEKFLATGMTPATWERVPGYAKEKIAAISYALWNSAEWLYVTDSQYLPEEDTLLFACSHKVRTGLVYRGPNLVFEPCGHFMDPYTWHGLQTPVPQANYGIKVVSTDAIHMVVDNCYQKHMNSLTWRRGFDIRAPRPYTMPGTFSAVNFRNVLVSRNMAWSLVASLPLPEAQPSPLAEQSVLLNLMVQRIAWDTSGMVGFLPSPQQSTPPACPSCEVNATIHTKGVTHVEKLSQWRCKSSHNLLQCLQQLNDYVSFNLTSKSTTLGSDVKILLDAWLDIFSSHGFPTATRIPLNESKLGEKNVGTPIQFTAAKSMHALSPMASLPPNAFAQLCKAKDGKGHAHQIPIDHPIKDILLVIVFNYPKLVAHIPKLDYLYGRHFKHMLYCTGSMADFRELHANKNPHNPVSFVEVFVQNGYWGHNCMATAIRAGYQVTGYLQISDDVIMNAWNFHSLPREMPWFQKSMRVAHVDHKLVPDIWTSKRWQPWVDFYGYDASGKIFKRLQAMRTVPGKVGEKVSALMDTIYNVTNCDRCLIYEASDIFYVPVKLAEDYAFFCDIFSADKVFLEITIPSILTGLVTDVGVYRLRGSYLWHDQRNKYADIYTEFNHFLHAWKMSRFADAKHTSFFCREVVSRMDRDVMAHNATVHGRQ